MKRVKIDFHVHTRYSPDGAIKIKDLIEKSRKLGIIPAVTDHGSINSFREFKTKKFKFIPGEEIKTDIGDLSALYIQEAIPKNTPFLEALDKIKEQGGISYLPHGFDPWRYNIGNKFPKYAEKVQIIEIFNARCFEKEFNKNAENFADKNNKLKAGGTDSHFLFEFGTTYTEIPDFDLTNPKELLKALKKAKIYGKLAPKYVKGTTSIYAKLKKIKRFFFGSEK